jgi:hypothetical protein
MTHGLQEIQLDDFDYFNGKLRSEDDPPSQLNFYQLFITREEMMVKTYVGEHFLFTVGWSSE